VIVDLVAGQNPTAECLQRFTHSLLARIHAAQTDLESSVAGEEIGDVRGSLFATPMEYRLSIWMSNNIGLFGFHANLRGGSTNRPVCALYGGSLIPGVSLRSIPG
jgi:hypothetical protein